MTGLFLAVLLLSAAALALVRLDRGAGSRSEITPCSALVLGHLFYSSALPVSRLLFASEPQEADTAYMFAHLLASSGLVLGFGWAWWRRGFRVAGRAAGEGACGISAGRATALMAVAFVVLFQVTLRTLGGDIGRVFARYGYEWTISREYDLAATMSPVAASVTVLVAVYGAFRQRGAARIFRLAAVGCLTALALFYLVRGSRNNFLIVALPALGLFTCGRALRYWRMAPLVLGGLLLFYAVAVVRAYGVERIMDVDLSAQDFDPLRGELGASFNVYTKYAVALAGDEAAWGRTYLVDPVVNLVPRDLYPGRPPTLAQDFTFRYHRRFEFGDGLGFSPVAEAVYNFSTAGILPLFVLVAVVLARLERFLRERVRHGALYLSLLLPMAVNFNRIDFATVFKMTVIASSMLWLCLKLSTVAPAASRRPILAARPC